MKKTLTAALCVGVIADLSFVITAYFYAATYHNLFGIRIDMTQPVDWLILMVILGIGPYFLWNDIANLITVTKGDLDTGSIERNMHIRYQQLSRLLRFIALRPFLFYALMLIPTCYAFFRLVLIGIAKADKSISYWMAD